MSMRKETRYVKKKAVYHPPNQLVGGRRVARGPRATLTDFGSGSSSSSSSVIISTVVVRGGDDVAVPPTTWGVGNGARRVLAGGGTVTNWVWTTILVSVS